MATVTSRIQSRKFTPDGAPSGTAVVSFSVASSGRLLSRRIARSSGSPILDGAALQIVERAAPFPPFPKGVGSQRLNFVVPMSFSRR
jgi:protein TonB